MLMRYYCQNMATPVLANDINRQQTALQLLAQGQTKQAVANELGISRPTVSQFAKANRDKIEAMMQQYINAIHEHTIIKDLSEIKAAKDISELVQSDLIGNPDAKGTANRLSFLTYVDKKETDIKRSIGTLSSHNVSIAVQNMSIYHSHTSIISPVIMQALGISGAPDAEDQGVDAEFYEST